MAISGTDRQLLIRVGADIADLRTKLRQVNVDVAATSRSVNTHERLQQSSFRATAKAMVDKRGALLSLVAAVSTTNMALRLFSAGNQHVAAQLEAAVAVVTTMAVALRSLAAAANLMRAHPVLLVLTVIIGALLLIGQRLGWLDALAQRLGLVADRTKALRDAQIEFLQAQGRVREAEVARLAEAREQMAKDTGDRLLAARIFFAKVAQMDREAADKRVAAVKSAGIAILEAEGRTLQARFAQIEAERKKIAEETGNEALAYEVAAAKKLQIERDFAERRVELFRRSAVELARAQGQLFQADLVELEAALAERRRMIAESTRAGVVSARDAQRLIAESEQTYAAERNELFKKRDDERLQFAFESRSKMLQVLKSTLEQELLAVEQTRHKELQSLQNMLQNQRVSQSEAAAFAVDVEQRAAGARVSIFADMIRKMKDNFASLTAAYQQSLNDLAQLDRTVAMKRAQLAGQSAQQITEIEAEALRRQAQDTRLADQDRLAASQRLIEILVEQAKVAAERRKQAEEAFAEEPSRERADQLQQARMAAWRAHDALTSARMAELKLLEDLRQKEVEIVTEREGALKAAKIGLDEFQKTYGTTLSALVQGAHSAGSELFQILGQRVPALIAQQWRVLIDQIRADLASFGKLFPSGGLTPIPAGAGPAPSALGGPAGPSIGQQFTVTGNTFKFEIPAWIRDPEQLKRFILDAVADDAARRNRRSP